MTENSEFAYALSRAALDVEASGEKFVGVLTVCHCSLRETEHSEDVEHNPFHVESGGLFSFCIPCRECEISGEPQGKLHRLVERGKRFFRSALLVGVAPVDVAEFEEA